MVPYNMHVSKLYQGGVSPAFFAESGKNFISGKLS